MLGSDSDDFGMGVDKVGIGRIGVGSVTVVTGDLGDTKSTES